MFFSILFNDSSLSTADDKKITICYYNINEQKGAPTYDKPKDRIPKHHYAL